MEDRLHTIRTCYSFDFYTSIGTKVQGYQYVADTNQRWGFVRVSRTGSEIHTLIKANPFTGTDFQSYLQNGLCDSIFFIVFILRSLLIRYIVLPESVRTDIYNNTGLSKTTLRSEIFDCALNIL